MGFKNTATTAAILAALAMGASPSEAQDKVSDVPPLPTVSDIVTAHNPVDKQMIIDLLSNDEALKQFFGDANAAGIVITTDSNTISLSFSIHDGQINRFASLITDVSERIDNDEALSIINSSEAINLEKLDSSTITRLSYEDIININKYFGYYLDFKPNGEYYIKKTLTLDPGSFRVKEGASLFSNRTFETLNIGNFLPNGILDSGVIISKNNVDNPLSVEVRGNDQKKVGPLPESEALFFMINLKDAFGIELNYLLPPDQFYAA